MATHTSVPPSRPVDTLQAPPPRKGLRLTAPAAAVRTVRRMQQRPPDTVQIGPYQYKVLMDADAQTNLKGVSPDVDGSDPDECVGLCDSHNLTILIDPTLAPSAMQAVFAHELIHAMDELVGLDDDSTEEDFANRLGPQLCDLLRRNPAVVAYLTGEHS